MKRKALLVLLPALAMALAGCNGSSSADDDEETSEQGSGAVLPEGVTEADFGTLSAPVTIANAKALLDKLDPNKGGETFAGYRLYVKGIVSANAEYSSQYGNYSYAYIADETAGDFSINKFIVASGVSGDWTAKNSMNGKEVVASGYACIYTDKNGNHKYEITSLQDAEKDEDKAQVHSIAEPPMPTDVNYGTLENPLSVSEAITEINKFPAKTTDQPLYVTGTVKSNTAYDTQYNNLDIVITDGENDFTLFRVTAIPGMTISEVGENGLVGATVIAHAVSTYYSQASKYETNANPTLDVFSLPASDVEFSTHSINLNTQSPAEDLDLSQYVNFLPAGAQPAEVVYAIVTEDSPVTINSETGVLDLTAVESDGSVVVSVTITGTAKTDSMTVNYTVPQAGQITSFALSSEAEEFFFNGTEEQKRADVNITNVLPQDHTEEFAVAEVKNTGTEQAPVWSAVEAEEAKVDVELNGAQDGLTVALKGSVESAGSTLVRVYPAEHIENGKNIAITISEFVDYGSLEDPLTIAEAKALMDAGKMPSGQQYYVTGEVKSNQGLAGTTYTTFNIVLTDGENDLTIFRASALPGEEWAGDNIKTLAVDQLVGTTVVAHGSPSIYQTTTYQISSPVVDSIEYPAITALSWKNEGQFEVGAGDTLDLSAQLVKTGFGDVTFAFSNEEEVPTGVTLDSETGVLTIPSTVEDAIVHVVATSVVGAISSEPCTISISSEAIVLDYGTLESPLSASEAVALIDHPNFDNTQTMYVGGTVKSNTAYSSKYSNFDVVIDDGTTEFTFFRLTAIPGWSEAEVQALKADDLKDYTVVAHGTGTKYNSTYELAQGCALDTAEAPAISALAFGEASYSKTVNGTDEATFNAASKLTVTGKTGTLVWSVTDPTDPADDKVKVLDASAGTVTIYSDVTDRTVTIRVELEEDSTIFAECDLVITVGGSEAVTESVTFSEAGYENQQVVENVSIGDCTVTFAKGSNSNAPKYFTTGAAVRAYGGNTITFTVSSANITSIVLTFASGEGSNAITSDVGTFDTNTWSGESDTVVLTIGGTSGHRRIASIQVTYQ